MAQGTRPEWRGDRDVGQGWAAPDANRGRFPLLSRGSQAKSKDGGWRFDLRQPTDRRRAARASVRDSPWPSRRPWSAGAASSLPAGPEPAAALVGEPVRPPRRRAGHLPPRPGPVPRGLGAPDLDARGDQGVPDRRAGVVLPERPGLVCAYRSITSWRTAGRSRSSWRCRWRGCSVCLGSGRGCRWRRWRLA